MSKPALNRPQQTDSEMPSSTETPPAVPASAVLGPRPWFFVRWWRALMRALLMPWIKTRVRGLPPGSDDSLRIYVPELHATSYELIIDAVLRQAGRSSVFRPAIDGKPRLLPQCRRQFPLGHVGDDRFRRLLGDYLAEVDRYDYPVEIVPVSVFIGRAPDKTEGLIRILAAEDWSIGGKIRRLFAIALHGRHTFVSFGQPLQLQQAADVSAEVDAISSALSTVFERTRSSVIGPDLSHRRTLVEDLVRTPAVKNAIAEHAERNQVSADKARRRARRYAREIAADYSYPVVSIFSAVLSWFWNRIYDGVTVKHFDTVTQAAASGNTIVYVPCHRSHIDYLLLSYVLHENGLVVPHIAAGLNLNLPIVGPILRRGGAFFLRRSFKSKRLYAAVFNQYVQNLVQHGISLEYFIEGTRSRTGRLLQPRGGMLAMTVKAFLAAPTRPVVFQPVYFGYEKLIEERSYLGELSGQEKKPETLGSLLGVFKLLRRQYGSVHVSFGQPIALNALLDAADPDWQQAGARPTWMNKVVDELGSTILSHINATVDVNPTQLLATALLASPKAALLETDLHRQLRLYRTLLTRVPYSQRQTLTVTGAQEVVEEGLRLQFIDRKPHPLGDIIAANDTAAVLLAYYRNNVAHLFIAPAWVACCFLNNVSFRRDQLVRLGKLIYPLFRAELAMSYSTEAFGEAVESSIQVLVDLGLLSEHAKDDKLRRAPGGTAQSLQLKLLGGLVIHSLERFYITTALLTKHGSSKLSAAELEELCQLSAQRLSMLYTAIVGPEFFDRRLFRTFINMLKAAGYLGTDPQGKLTFGNQVEGLLEDAKVILSKELRHNILQITDYRPAIEPPATE